MLIRNVSRQCGTYIVFLPPTKFDVPQSLKLFSEDNTVNRTVKGGGQTIADHYWLLFWLALSKVTYASLAVQNSSIGDLVTHSLTHSLTVLLLLTYSERPQRLVTFETFDQSDEET